jgi:hypothetical protein
LTFVPALTHIDKISGSESLSIFNRERTPLDRLFAGEKLFLAAHPFVGPNGRREFRSAVEGLAGHLEKPPYPGPVRPRALGLRPKPPSSVAVFRE